MLLTMKKTEFSKKTKVLLFGFLIISVSVFFAYYMHADLFWERVGYFFYGRKNPYPYSVTIGRFAYEHSITASVRLNRMPLSYAHYNLARISFVEGSLIESISEANQEEHYYPKNYVVYYIRALSYGFLSHEDKGIHDLEFYLKQYPDSWPARNDLAWLYFRVGNLDKAYETILPATTMFKGTPWVEVMYGSILLNQKHYKEAKEAFLRAERTVNVMTSEDWGRAYPGNDPRIYGDGLISMKKMIEENLKLVDEKLSTDNH